MRSSVGVFSVFTALRFGVASSVFFQQETFPLTSSSKRVVIPRDSSISLPSGRLPIFREFVRVAANIEPGAATSDLDLQFATINILRACQNPLAHPEQDLHWLNCLRSV